MSLISVTRLRVRALRYLPGFLFFALVSAREARRARGNRGADLLAEAKRTFWTSTAWEDEASMREFMMAPPHRLRCPDSSTGATRTSVVHWLQESPELPDWQEAHGRMAAEGRRSKVRHPWPAHEAFEIPPPAQRGG